MGMWGFGEGTERFGAGVGDLGKEQADLEYGEVIWGEKGEI